MKEALLGLNKTLKHLDGHLFEINKNSITQPGDVETYYEKGMPMKDDPSKFGKLFVHFKVEFPDALSEQQSELFKQFFK